MRTWVVLLALFVTALHEAAAQDAITIAEMMDDAVVLSVDDAMLKNAIVRAEDGAFTVQILLVETLARPYLVAHCDDGVLRAYECRIEDGKVLLPVQGEAHACSPTACADCRFMYANNGAIVGCECIGADTRKSKEGEQTHCGHRITSNQSELVATLHRMLKH